LINSGYSHKIILRDEIFIELLPRSRSITDNNELQFLAFYEDFYHGSGLTEG
jgi:hypothetical protein